MATEVFRSTPHAIVPPDETERVEASEGPFEPPPTTPRIHLPPALRRGLPFLLLPTVLALAGVFDPHPRHEAHRLGPIAVAIESPDRLRVNRHGEVIVALENRGREPESALVAISPEYLADFVNIEMTPPAHRTWATRLESIEPGERRVVAIEFEAEGAGTHRGVVRVRTDRGEEAATEISTFVFP